MKLLAVDTALGACSVVLLDGGQMVAHRHVPMDRGHAEALAPMVEEVMAATPFDSLDRLAVTIGPGTFTGQRVGFAFMRGLRLALDIPLVGVTTLAAMAAQAKSETGLPRAVALHDAKRDEVYVELEGVLPPSVLPFGEAIELLLRQSGPFALAGTAAVRACVALANGAVLSDVRQPDALWVARLAAGAEPAFAVPRPLYLRAPDAKLPAPKVMEITTLSAISDLAPLARLHCACFAKGWSEDAIRDLLRSPGVFVLGGARGFVMARSAVDEAEILTLVVAADARRRGIASALLSQAATLAYARGARALFLEVEDSNIAARKLYDCFGFRAVGLRRDYLAAGQVAHTMRAELPLTPLGIPRGSIRLSGGTSREGS